MGTLQYRHSRHRNNLVGHKLNHQRGMNPIFSKQILMQIVGLGEIPICMPPKSLFPQIQNLVLVIISPKPEIDYVFRPLEGHLLNRD